mmetsp:Transcript_36072/g.119478  ORF Transcript_36072/g.119478 Transcript_36072/m.119478 type:complete len:238 (+) Transcript_36072:1031-1744(+)
MEAGAALPRAGSRTRQWCRPALGPRRRRRREDKSDLVPQCDPRLCFWDRHPARRRARSLLQFATGGQPAPRPLFARASACLVAAVDRAARVGWQRRRGARVGPRRPLGAEAAPPRRHRLDHLACLGALLRPSDQPLSGAVAARRVGRASVDGASAALAPQLADPEGPHRRRGAGDHLAAASLGRRRPHRHRNLEWQSRCVRRVGAHRGRRGGVRAEEPPAAAALSARPRVALLLRRG